MKIIKLIKQKKYLKFFPFFIQEQPLKEQKRAKRMTLLKRKKWNQETFQVEKFKNKKLK